MTIGQRAAEQVRKMAAENGVSLNFETICLGVATSTFAYWAKGKSDPGSPVLAKMLEMGYDIDYILLGKENNNAN